MTLAFFGCLRASEFTVQGSFDPAIHLCGTDVNIIQDQNPPYASVFIKHSKTDIYNKGVTIYVGCTADSTICAHCAQI